MKLMPNGYSRSIAMIALVVVVGLAVVAVAPIAVADDTANEEANNETEADDLEACEIGPNDPNLRQAGLHTTDDEIEIGSPAEIAGQFRLSSASECAVEVSVTLSAPNGIYFQDGQNIEGGTSGLAHGEFLVDGGDPEEVRATVYSEIEGEHLITADVEYWPVGHPDEVKTQTFRMSVDALEPNDDEFTDDGEVLGTSSDNDIPVPTEGLLITLIAIALVGLIGIAYKGTNAEVVNKFIKR